MSTQNIVKFINTLLSVETDAFVELIKNKNGISIITVRTHKDKFDVSNETLLYKFMTNNFAQVTFDNTESSVILQYRDNNNMEQITSIIKFDNNSSSAYNDFKKNFNEMYNTKYETEYYTSGREMYVGEVLYRKDSKDVVIDRIPNGMGTMYYDLPGHMIKYSGEFEAGLYDGKGTLYSKDNKISLTLNNISSGVPIKKGKLHINYSKKKETIEIDFNDIWKKYNITDKVIKNQIVLTDNFIVDLARVYWSDNDIIPMEAMVFQDKSLDDKYLELWTMVRENGNKLDNLEKSYNTLVVTQSRLLYIDNSYKIYNFENTKSNQK